MRLPLDLCKATERKQGAWVGMRRWEKTYIDLEGARDREVTVAEVGEYGMED